VASISACSLCITSRSIRLFTAPMRKPASHYRAAHQQSLLGLQVLGSSSGEKIACRTCARVGAWNVIVVAEPQTKLSSVFSFKKPRHGFEPPGATPSSLIRLSHPRLRLFYEERALWLKSINNSVCASVSAPLWSAAAYSLSYQPGARLGCFSPRFVFAFDADCAPKPQDHVTRNFPERSVCNR